MLRSGRPAVEAPLAVAGGNPYAPLDEVSASRKVAEQRCRCCGTCCVWFLAVFAVAALPAWYACHHNYEIPEAQTIPLIQKYFDGRQWFNWWNLPAVRSEKFLEDCDKQLFNRTNDGRLTWGATSAVEGVRLAYHCSKVPGVFEQVPEILRGVFWMKGNAIGEELAVLQNGRWFPEEQTYVVPFAPYMWAWAAGRPKDSPLYGAFYTEEMLKYAAAALSMGHVGFSFKFRECPESAKLPFPLGNPGHACKKGEEFGYATLNIHSFGDVATNGHDDIYTIEGLNGVEEGSRWLRGIYGGPDWLVGRCKCVSVGSYHLTKILDGDGHPIEPYFSEFISYMGEVPLFFWSGYADPKMEKELRSGKVWDAETFFKTWNSTAEPSAEAAAAAAGLAADALGGEPVI